MAFRRFASYLLITVLAVLCLFPAAAPAEEKAETIVRVGWYETPFNHKDAYGRRSGYAYDFQRKIAAYLNCSPSTITYELRRGTPERTGTRGPAPTDKARLGQQRYEENRQRCRKRPAVLKCSAFLSWLKGRIRERKWSFDACVGHARRRGAASSPPRGTARPTSPGIRRSPSPGTGSTSGPSGHGSGRSSWPGSPSAGSAARRATG